MQKTVCESAQPFFWHCRPSYVCVRRLVAPSLVGPARSPASSLKMLPKYQVGDRVFTPATHLKCHVSDTWPVDTFGSANAGAQPVRGTVIAVYPSGDVLVYFDQRNFLTTDHEDCNKLPSRLLEPVLEIEENPVSLLPARLRRLLKNSRTPSANVAGGNGDAGVDSVPAETHVPARCATSAATPCDLQMDGDRHSLREAYIAPPIAAPPSVIGRLPIENEEVLALAGGGDVADAAPGMHANEPTEGIVDPWASLVAEATPAGNVEATRGRGRGRGPGRFATERTRYNAITTPFLLPDFEENGTRTRQTSNDQHARGRGLAARRGRPSRRGRGRTSSRAGNHKITSRSCCMSWDPCYMFN